MKRVHDLPFGASVLADGTVELCLENQTGEEIVLPMNRLSDGWFQFEISVGLAWPGTLYFYRIDSIRKVPDPASRSNTQDVHGPSRMVDATAFDRLHDDWQGHSWQEAVIYVLHVVTFTVEVSQAGLPEYFVAGGMPPWCAAWFIEDARHEI